MEKLSLIVALVFSSLSISQPAFAVYTSEPCDINSCGKTFTSERKQGDADGHLNEHKKTHNLNRPTFTSDPCPTCGLTFSSSKDQSQANRNLKRHKERKGH